MELLSCLFRTVGTFELHHNESKRYQRERERERESVGTSHLNHGTWQVHDKCLAFCSKSPEKRG